jgi:hypothetical protein
MPGVVMKLENSPFSIMIKQLLAVIFRYEIRWRLWSNISDLLLAVSHLKPYDEKEAMIYGTAGLTAGISPDPELVKPEDGKKSLFLELQEALIIECFYSAKLGYFCSCYYW